MALAERGVRAEAKAQLLGIDLGLGGAFWLKDVSGGPNSFDDMDEIENRLASWH